jgi:hypothetical protein
LIGTGVGAGGRVEAEGRFFIHPSLFIGPEESCRAQGHIPKLIIANE